MARPDWRALAERQAGPLDRLVGRGIRAARDTHESFRRELIAMLTDATPQGETLTPADLPWLLPRIRGLVDAYARRYASEQADARSAVRALVSAQAIEIVGAFEPPEVAAAVADALTGADSQDDPATALFVARFWRSVGDDVEGAAASSAVQRMPWALFVRRAAAPDGSAVSRTRGRAQVVADMEARRAAAQQAGDAVRRTARSVPNADTDPVLRRIVEIIDKHNHPISRVLDGQAQPIGAPFRAPVEDVFIQSRLLRKGVGGIVWTRLGGAFIGESLPAHYADRGRIVPFRKSWET